MAQFFRRKKSCKFSSKNAARRSTTRTCPPLKQYIGENGKIVPARITGTKSRYQRELATAIKRARFLALLPVQRQPRLRRTTMEVILLEKIKKLGDLGESVKVKAGFGRNYLLPQGKALPATEANRKVFETRKADLLKKVATTSVNAAKMRAEKINGKSRHRSRCWRLKKASSTVRSVRPKSSAPLLPRASTFKKSEIDMVLGPIRAGRHLHRQSVRLHTEVEAVDCYGRCRKAQKAVAA